MQINIEKLIYGGFGLGRDLGGRPIFVRKSVPGDILDIKIIKDKKSYSEGIINKIIEPSPDRIEPKCPHFEQCGGCEHQNISYQNQLKYKEAIFRETLSRAKVETEVLPIIAGSDSEYFYRNTMRFYFLTDSEKISVAMHHFNDSDKLIPIGECCLQSEWSSDFCRQTVQFINDNVDDKSNFFQLRIREGKFTGDKMVEIITSSADLPEKQKFIQFLRQFAEIKSAYHTAAVLDNLLDANRSILFGSPIIYEKVGKFTFQLSPESFFQTNSMGIKTLYDKIKEFANVESGDRILDLYCGTGTIGIYLSTLAREITGVEEIQSAVNDANSNAKINKMHNCNFVCSDAARWLNNETMKQWSNVIVNPPREGLDKEVILRLSTFNFQLLTYISCNPSTFARDIKEFEKLGLKLERVQPIDMFPQTHHIECVGLLTK